jgi:chromosome segregation ATPase
MTLVAEGEAVRTVLSRVAGELRTLLIDSEKEMEGLGHDFQALAREANAILEAAGVIVSCAESERMASVLPGVQKLAGAAQEFIRGRLEATAGVLDTVVAEEKLLERLTQLTRGQKAIVKETGMLRVLTNIEVARLGEVGAGFEYLAHELDDFSQAVARSTSELMEHTESRRKATGETRRTLANGLPGMREQFARIGKRLESAVGEVDAALGELRQTPQRFRSCVEEVATQIAGVVSAIQSHDITRQQIDHVEIALRTIAEAGEQDGAMARAGLTIQNYQLRNVRRTIDGWTAQIRSCLEGIGHIASAELLDLGRAVMRQEGALSAQLTHIDRLEEECESSDAQVQASFAGIAGLMQLVTEHLERSKSVRDRLQLLMFNSIVEASHLGTQADGILEISTSIKRISATWAGITTQSEEATGQIRGLVEASHGTVESFSEASYAGLREARGETMTGLEVLREAASCAERKGAEVEDAVRKVQARIAEIGATGERLEAGFRRLEAALEEIESVRRQMEEEGRGEGSFDRGAVEQRFAENYTTEMERAVLRAALEGGPLPPVEETLAGNSVELF